VLRRAARVPDAVTGGRDTVGLRVPDHPAAQAVLRAFGGGVAAPSANRFGRVSPTTAAHVVADLAGHLDPARDAVLDGGPCRVGVESTIVDCTGPVPQVLRPGGVGADELERVLRGPVERVATGPARAPGMLAAHYAPDARVVVVDALADALAEFEGGVIVISHDAQLLETVCADEERAEVWLVEDGAVTKYDGYFEDYRDELLKEISAEMEADDAAAAAAALDEVAVIAPESDHDEAAAFARSVGARLVTVDGPSSVPAAVTAALRD